MGADPAGGAAHQGERGVRLHRVGRAALLTIDRPQVRNAIDQQTAREIYELARRADASPDVRVIAITGAGEQAFCAGADLKSMAEGGERPSWKDAGFAGFVRLRLRKPSIAVVNGDAVGGGFELALACDIVIACDEARFCLPEPRRGLVAGGGGLVHVPRRLPAALASDLLLTARWLDAHEAKDFGLVSRMVRRADLLDEFVAVVDQLCEGSPRAVEATCAALRRVPWSRDVEAAWVFTESLAEWVRDSGDPQEGARAFRDGSAPAWSSRSNE